MVGEFRQGVQALLRGQAVETMGWHLTTLSPMPIDYLWAAARLDKTRQDKTTNTLSYFD